MNRVANNRSGVGEDVSQIREPFSQDSAYEAARSVARRVVSIGATIHGTKGAAIDRISRKYSMGSFLKKVYQGEPATIHLHLYDRLCLALEELNNVQRQQVSENQELLRELRGRNAACLRHWSTFDDERGPALAIDRG